MTLLEDEIYVINEKNRKRIGHVTKYLLELFHLDIIDILESHLMFSTFSKYTKTTGTCED